MNTILILYMKQSISHSLLSIISHIEYDWFLIVLNKFAEGINTQTMI